MSDLPPRPRTPQVLLHRLPEKPDASSEASRKPSKYIILIMGSTSVAGKVQIAKEVASELSCALYQGDSMHESSAKAAGVGASRRAAAAAAAGAGSVTSGPSGAGANEALYQRMWLSKMTRTGLLFPEESRPANEGISSGLEGGSGTSSTSSSRRGSGSSVASASSRNTAASFATEASSVAGSSSVFTSSGPPSSISTTTSAPYIRNPVFTLPEHERLRRTNPALMVLTHPGLEKWHKLAIRNAVGEYGIGIIFVPLASEEEEDEDELPVLQPLNPMTMTSFPTSFGAFAKQSRAEGNLDHEMKLVIDVDADVEGKIREIVNGAREVMGVEG